MIVQRPGTDGSQGPLDLSRQRERGIGAVGALCQQAEQRRIRAARRRPEAAFESVGCSQGMAFEAVEIERGIRQFRGGRVA